MREQFRAQHVGVRDDGRPLVRAVFEFGATAGGAIHILPAGPHVAARDGREFSVSDAARVIAQTETPLLLDWDHESERANGSTKAAGWVHGLAVEKGDGSRAAGIWGVLEPTPEGLADIKARKYRYLSPVLALDRESRDVLSIEAVALTNRPALVLQGIDRDLFHMKGGTDMTISKTLSSIPAPVLSALRARGISDTEIAAAHAYSVQRRAEVDPDAGDDEQPAGAPTRGPRREAHRAPPGGAPAPLQSAVDRILLGRGVSQTEIDAARKYRADQLAAVRR
jgi:hypothetical protein